MKTSDQQVNQSCLGFLTTVSAYDFQHLTLPQNPLVCFNFHVLFSQQIQIDSAFKLTLSLLTFRKPKVSFSKPASK